MKIKYIIINDIFPVIISDGMAHADTRRMGKPTSAGFCDFDRDENSNWKVTCFGRSESLNLDPAPHDAILIERLLES